jgi:hypothetical protein
MSDDDIQKARILRLRNILIAQHHLFIALRDKSGSAIKRLIKVADENVQTEILSL